MGSDPRVKASLEALRARVEGFRRFLEGLEPLVLPCTPTRRRVRGGNGSPYWYWYMVCKDGGVGRSVYAGSRPPRGIRRSEYSRALRLAGRLSGLLDELERVLEEVERLEAELSEKARLASGGGGGGAVRVEYACSGCGATVMVVDAGDLSNGGLMATRDAVRELGGVCPRCGRILSEEPLRAEAP